MSDLIRRQDAFKAVLGVTTYDTVDDVEISCGYSVLDSEGWLGGVRDALRAIESVPSAEPERKIIHCKDCKFYTPMNRKLKTGICSMTMHHLGDDGFCSTAEKRGE